MGKAEERGGVDCAELCEESLIWFEGLPTVVGGEPMAAGFFCILVSHIYHLVSFYGQEQKVLLCCGKTRDWR